MITIRNLPHQLGERELLKILESFGSVARLVFNPTGAQVRMRDREAALDAVSHLNGKSIAGSRLVVRSVR